MQFQRIFCGHSLHGRNLTGALNFVRSLTNVFGTPTQKEMDNNHRNLNDLKQLTENERRIHMIVYRSLCCVRI